MSISTRVATYSRVSTEFQDLESQKDELRKYVANRGWVLVEEIEDHGYSGSTKDRPGLKKLNDLVFKRKIDIVLVSRLDRMFRSVAEIVHIVNSYQNDFAVTFISLREQLDLSSAVGRLQFHVLAALSEFEKSLISDRTKASLNYLKSQGVKLGRPKLHDEEKIIVLRKGGMSYRAICKETNAPMGVVSRVIRDALLTPLKIQPQEKICALPAVKIDD